MDQAQVFDRITQSASGYLSETALNQLHSFDLSADRVEGNATVADLEVVGSELAQIHGVAGGQRGPRCGYQSIDRLFCINKSIQNVAGHPEQDVVGVFRPRHGVEGNPCGGEDRVGTLSETQP